jgi:hypothetical protein
MGIRAIRSACSSGCLSAFLCVPFVFAGNTEEAKPDEFVQAIAKNGYVYVLRSVTISKSRIDGWSDRNRIKPAQEEILWQGSPLDRPSSIAVDDAGDVLVADSGAGKIFIKSPHDELRAVPTSSQVAAPRAIAVKGEQVYVADSRGNAIYQVPLSGGDAIQIYEVPDGYAPEKMLIVGGKLLGLNSRSRSLILLSLVQGGPEKDSDHNLISDSPTRGELLRVNANGPLDIPAIDFAASKSILYILGTKAQSKRQTITALPLIGGATASFELPDPDGRDWSALTIADDRLLLANGEQIASIPLVVPASLSVDAQLSSEPLTSLYSYLLSSGVLQTKKYQLDEGESVAALVKNKLVLPAGYVESFDFVFCRLNARHCYRGKPKSILQPGDSTILPNIDKDSIASRRTITLPFTRDQFSDPRFARNAGGTLGEIAGQFVFGADKSRLRSDLLKLNYTYTGKNILKATAGTFEIPVQLFKATFPVVKADVDDRNSGFYALHISGGSISSPAQVDSLSPQSGHAHVATQIGPAKSPQPTDSRCALLPPKLWSRALEIINYCEPLVQPARGQGSVAVVDYHFDPTHPEFLDPASHVSALIPYKYPAPLEHKAIPAANAAGADQEWDHGTHLAALIGARGASEEMIGLDPESKIFGIKIGEFSEAVDKEYGLHIYNISLGFDQERAKNQTNSFRDIIQADQRRNVLFVVSAGNENRRVKDEGLAALGDRENVIVVGATDEGDPPRPWERSNYDNRLVSLVAPGKELKSALFGGGYTAESGTSQATALVSGAATLLSTVEQNWPPWKIKQRLVSSADLWDGGDANRVLSGILNVKAAVLDTNAAVFRLHSGDTCVAQIDYVGPVPAKLITLTQAGGDITQVHHSEVRRIHRQKDGSTFTFIYSVRTKDTKNNVLERQEVSGNQIDGATSLQIGRKSVGCGNRRVIAITDIDDLLNGFYDPK